jgi:hypothetical protein
MESSALYILIPELELTEQSFSQTLAGSGILGKGTLGSYTNSEILRPDFASLHVYSWFIGQKTSHSPTWQEDQ